ncbi:hypothetical protein MNBD_ALPHA06-37 [hydrothermal vent metagenome]|uniref:DUF2975 domain-containing protein n=1 Tax=hydrothermal vent metagenome TaxID=652676 RepID=A0A3B0S4E3_9ZZZZ
MRKCLWQLSFWLPVSISFSLSFMAGSFAYIEFWKSIIGNANENPIYGLLAISYALGLVIYFIVIRIFLRQHLWTWNKVFRMIAQRVLYEHIAICALMTVSFLLVAIFYLVQNGFGAFMEKISIFVFSLIFFAVLGWLSFTTLQRFKFTIKMGKNNENP